LKFYKVYEVQKSDIFKSKKVTIVTVKRIFDFLHIHAVNMLVFFTITSLRKNSFFILLFFFLDASTSSAQVQEQKKTCLPRQKAQLQPFGEKFLIDQFTKRVSAAADKRQALFGIG
jgi:hypothetical protein